MPSIKSITVYCGSSNDVDVAYLDLARRLGRAIAGRGMRLVYGGGNVGLMGQVALSAHEAGGKVLGIMPKFLRDIEGDLSVVEHWLVDTMHERKKLLLDEADGFIVLPGGIGTVEEAVETLSWAKLSLHSKPMAFLSENGYWAPLFHLVDHMIEGGFLNASFRRLMADTTTPADAIDALDSRAVALD
jgi:uncharacterized protein (TIGR00730 family)